MITLILFAAPPRFVSETPRRSIRPSAIVGAPLKYAQGSYLSVFTACGNYPITWNFDVIFHCPIDAETVALPQISNLTEEEVNLDEGYTFTQFNISH